MLDAIMNFLFPPVPKTVAKIDTRTDDESIFTADCERLVLLATEIPFDPEDVGHENWLLMLWGNEHGPLGMYDAITLTGDGLCSSIVYHLEEGGLIWKDKSGPCDPITNRRILRDDHGRPCALIMPTPRQKDGFLVLLAPGVSMVYGGEFIPRQTEYFGRSWLEAINEGMHLENEVQPQLTDSEYL